MLLSRHFIGVSLFRSSLIKISAGCGHWAENEVHTLLIHGNNVTSVRHLSKQHIFMNVNTSPENHPKDLEMSTSSLIELSKFPLLCFYSFVYVSDRLVWLTFHTASRLIVPTTHLSRIVGSVKE